MKLSIRWLKRAAAAFASAVSAEGANSAHRSSISTFTSAAGITGDRWSSSVSRGSCTPACHVCFSHRSRGGLSPQANCQKAAVPVVSATRWMRSCGVGFSTL
jgi:hypothetical protein